MAKIPDNPFTLIDGSSYLFRAFYAMPPLTTKTGIPTGAIYGVINMLRNIIKQYKPSNMAVVFDAKGKNFRHELFPEYKANRDEMPDELAKQIKPLHEVINAMGIPIISIKKVEADDVIGTIAKKAENEGKFTLISTSDKDMAQLVNDQIILINTMTNSILDKKGVEKKFKIPPNLIVDYLSLIGDSSDNIPGIPKVGPKTAVKWLTEYGNLEKIILNADKIKGVVGENLRNNIENLKLFKELTTIKTNIDIESNFLPKHLILKKENANELKTLFKELEFKTWLNEIQDLKNNIISLNTNETTSKKSHDNEDLKLNKTEKNFLLLDNLDNITKTITTQNDRTKYKTILTEKELNSFIKKLEQTKIFSIDLETDNLDPFNANIVGISFAIENDNAYYIPIAHTYEKAPTQLNIDFILNSIKPSLEDSKKFKILHNAKYDSKVLKNYNITINHNNVHDTMLQSYVLNSTSGKHNLFDVALRELNLTTLKYEDVTGKGAKQISFNQVNIKDATQYAAEDADITLKLHKKMFVEIQKHSGLNFIYSKIELPLLFILEKMETVGVLIDKEILKEQSKILAKNLETLTKDARNITDCDFNMNSPKQLQELLYEKLKLPILQKTPKGQPSTAENVLQELANSYELPKIILSYRSLSKLKSTYTDKLPEKIDPKTKRVHTSFHQAITSTGRLSSSDPNLQNIPIKTTIGKKIRNAFIAPKGFKILSADYSQIELRILAHLSKDKTLLNAFANNEDIHKITAAKIWNIPIDEVTDEQRRNVKAVNFGILYGMSSFGLSKQIGTTRKQSQQYIDSYFSKFPKILDFIEATKEKAKQDGFIETIFGRRLYLPDINSKNAIRRKAAERAATNAPMQGAQADIIKLAMIKIDNWINQESKNIKMILQVHDELVFEIPDDLVEIAKDKISNIMSNIVKLDLELKVHVGIGNNWEDAH